MSFVIKSGFKAGISSWDLAERFHRNIGRKNVVYEGFSIAPAASSGSIVIGTGAASILGVLVEKTDSTEMAIPINNEAHDVYYNVYLDYDHYHAENDDVQSKASEKFELATEALDLQRTLVIAKVRRAPGVMAINVEDIEREAEFFDSELPKAVYTADREPAEADDADNGFKVGSEWLFEGTLYKCTDATPGAAQWSIVGRGHLNQLHAGSAPTSSSDSTEGYTVGSEWLFGDIWYKCIDATPGAAMWRELGDSGAQHNLYGGRIPDVNDDVNAGYSVGSEWLYNGTWYKCTNNSAGSAVWLVVGSGGGGLAGGSLESLRVVTLMYAADEVGQYVEGYTGLFYDLFNGANDRSMAQLDMTKAKSIDPLSTGQALINLVYDEAGMMFRSGDEVTVYDDQNYEHVVISSVGTSAITLQTGLTRGYKRNANIARSVCALDTSEETLETGTWDHLTVTFA